MIGEFFIIKYRIKKYLKKIFTNDNDKVLDLGCGKNPYYHKIMKGKIVCMDISKTDKTHIVADADLLPLKKNSFDKIIMVNSLYYFKNPFNALENIGAVLKKNGKLVIVAPFMYPIHDAPDDKYRFTEFGLREMLQDNFKVLSINTAGGFFALPAVVLHSLIKGTPLLFPREIRKIVQVLAYILWPLYIAAQLIGILDMFDRTGRYPIYYIAVAQRK